MVRMTAASRPHMRYSVYSVELEVHMVDLGGSEEESDLAGVKLGRGIGSECCAPERNPPL